MAEPSDAHQPGSPYRGEPPAPGGPGVPGLPMIEGPGYRYVARQLLVNASDVETVRGEIDRLHGEVDWTTTERLHGLVICYLMPPEVPLPALVTQLRSLKPRPRVGLNHILLGVPNTHGGPYGDPTPAPDPGVAAGNPGVPVAVLDTGVAKDLDRRHSPLFKRFKPLKWPEVENLDDVYDPKTRCIAACGGHGEFVAGIIARLSGNAVITPIRVLSPVGLGSDVDVADGIWKSAEVGAQVINMSLAGYAQDDEPLVACGAALDALDKHVSVVAAAGNNGDCRPAWPAAFLRVAGCAALDTTCGRTDRGACFTNWGPWVDLCAPGVEIHSTWVDGDWVRACGAKLPFHEGGARWSGTSFAAPYVVAAIVECMAKNHLSATDAETWLRHGGKGQSVPELGVAVI